MRLIDSISEDVKEFLLEEWFDIRVGQDIPIFILHKKDIPENIPMEHLIRSNDKVKMSYSEYFLSLRNKDNVEVKILRALLTAVPSCWDNNEAPKYDLNRHEELIEILKRVVSKNKRYNKDTLAQSLLTKNYFCKDDVTLIIDILCSDNKNPPYWLEAYHSNNNSYNHYIDNKESYDLIRKIQQMTVGEFFDIYEIVLN